MQRVWFVGLMVLTGLVTAAGSAVAQKVAVEEFTLPNGMQFLLVPRADQPNVVSAGWVARVGSVNERPGITGISHFFEHMMFRAPTRSAPATQTRIAPSGLSRRRFVIRSTNWSGMSSMSGIGLVKSMTRGIRRATRLSCGVCGESSTR